MEAVGTLREPVGRQRSQRVRVTAAAAADRATRPWRLVEVVVKFALTRWRHQYPVQDGDGGGRWTRHVLSVYEKKIRRRGDRAPDDYVDTAQSQKCQ